MAQFSWLWITCSHGRVIYFFLGNESNATTKVPNVIIKERASYTFINLTPFQGDEPIAPKPHPTV